jgi:hypothetical protein
MGILTGLLTLPLAPVRGVAWIAEELAEEATRQLYDESRLRRELLELEMDHDAGLVSDKDYQASADDLIARLRAAREFANAGIEGS